MNMLTNKIAFGLLSDEKRNMFRDAGIKDCAFCVGFNTECDDIWDHHALPSNTDIPGTSSEGFLYKLIDRLKPKEDKWYFLKNRESYLVQLKKVLDNGDIEVKKHKKEAFGMENHNVFYAEHITAFRPATKEEIERNKPKEKDYIDIKLNWDEDGCYIEHESEIGYLRCSEYPICHTTEGWVMIGYVFKDLPGGEDGCAHFHPMTFKDNKIIRKATHARFVRMK